MASYDTAVYATQKLARANPSRLADPNIASGTVEFAVVPYTLTGSEIATDIINLMLIPSGAIPVPQLSRVTCEDPGTALTFDIGTAADSDGWGRAVAAPAGGNISFADATNPQAAWIAPTPIVADSGGSGTALVRAAVTTATALTANTVIYFLLAWKRFR